MFIMTDDKQLINTRYIRNIKIEGMKLNLIGSVGDLLGIKTLENEIDLENTINNICVSQEARAIDRVAFQLEDLETMIENICIELHKKA